MNGVAMKPAGGAVGVSVQLFGFWMLNFNHPAGAEVLTHWEQGHVRAISKANM